MDKYWGHRNKKHKKQPFADASASHLPLVLWHVWFQAGAWISHTTPLTPPSYEVGGIAKRIKTARLRRKTKPGRDVILRKHWKTIKIVNEVKILWRLVAVGNGWLWLTPCKRMKLRRSEWAQLGVSTKEGVSLVEGRLWSRPLMLPRPTVSDARHYIWTCLQAALASELAWS